jgi:hypothetical protein
MFQSQRWALAGAAATLPGATSEWAGGINATDQALILSHG